MLPDISVIIVNFNTKELIKDCLNSIIKQTRFVNYEIIVSDNGSTDGSIDLIKNDFPSVILLENKQNLGFGRANNKGLDIAKGKYIFYLNSDTVLLNNALKYFFDYYEKNGPNLGAIGANLLDYHMNVTHSYGNFPNYKSEVKFRFKNSFKLLVKRLLFSLGFNYNKKRPPTENFYIGNVDYITGADLFLLNNNLARFDERFFLYYEETDLQLQLAKKGLERKIIDGPKIQHLCNALNANTNDVERARSFSSTQSDKSSILYFSKNLFPNKQSRCLLLKIVIYITWFFIGA